MFRNKKKRHRGKQLGFDYDLELRKYKYLNGMLNKWQTKRLNHDEKFETYKDWENHIVITLEKKSKEELEELSKYLRFCSRTMSGFDIGWNNFVIPLMLGIFLNEITELLEFYNMNILSASEILKQCYDFLLEAPDYLYMKAIASIPLWLAVGIVILPYGFVITMVCILAAEISFYAIKREEEKAFGEDYQAIIDKVLRDRD